MADGRETREFGESIAQRSRRSQRGEDYRGEASATPWLMGEKRANLGKASHRGHGGHRGGGLSGRGFGDAMADKRETREFGESIAQRSRRSQRGRIIGERLRRRHG